MRAEIRKAGKYVTTTTTQTNHKDHRLHITADDPGMAGSIQHRPGKRRGERSADHHSKR